MLKDLQKNDENTIKSNDSKENSVPK